MATNASTGTELSEGLGEQAGAYMILPTGRNHSGGPKSSSSPAKPSPKTELSEGLGEQAGAYMILPTPGHNHNSSSPSPATKAAGEAPFNFNAAAGAIIEAGYEEGGAAAAAMMELDRGMAGKAISATATAASAGARMVFAGDDDEGAGVHSFADPADRGGATTTVDVARMKADETIGAAMQAAKEAGDVVSGHKWF